MIEWFASLGATFDFERRPPPFSHWIWPIGGGITYLASLALLKAVLKRRDKPFKLHWFIPFIHNVFLCLLSITMASGLLFHAARRAIEQGTMMAVLCPREPQNYMRGGLVFWAFVFYLSKYYEFLDTAISVVRGHNVLPLHVYHHAVMPLLVWSWFVGNWPLHWYGCFVNSFVHIIMYFYYAIKTLGKEVWWKRYVTSIQIVQFCSVFALIWLFWGLSLIGPRSCVGSLWVTSFSQFVNLSFLALFVQFYRRTYRRRLRNGELRHDNELKKTA